MTRPADEAAELRHLEAQPGWARLRALIDAEMTENWEAFIALPAEKKTGKAAQAHQARHAALKWLKTLPSEKAAALEFPQRRGKR